MAGFGFCGGSWWIFPLLMILLCFLFMRGGRRGRMCGLGSIKGESAAEILNKRYARGDIDQEEYERKKRELSDR